jgi:hypothetical protein
MEANREGKKLGDLYVAIEHDSRGDEQIAVPHNGYGEPLIAEDLDTAIAHVFPRVQDHADRTGQTIEFVRYVRAETIQVATPAKR